MFIRFDRMYERDGRTDGQTNRQTDWKTDTAWQHRPRLHSIARHKWLKPYHLHEENLQCKGPFIATQLNSTQTQLNSTQLNSTAWTTVDSVCRSWRYKQKHDWLGCTLFDWVSWVQLSSVELCRYKHPLRHNKRGRVAIHSDPWPYLLLFLCCSQFLIIFIHQHKR